MSSELKKLWNKRNELYKKQEVPTVTWLFYLRQKRIRQLDKQINNFDKSKDEYHWKKYFDSLVV